MLGKVESRECRFYLHRIEKIALCKDIVKPYDYFNTITQKLCDLIPEIPYAMDQFYNYLCAVDL